MPRFTLSAVLPIIIGIALGALQVQAWPTSPPVSGIFDDTRALPETAEATLSELIAAFRVATDSDAWLVAVTQLDSDASPRTQSRELRRRWSEDRPAILLLYNRGTDSASISVSPHFWDRYPAAELIAALQVSGRHLEQKAEPLETRLAGSMTGLMDRITKLEILRMKQSQGLTAAELRGSAAFAGALVLLALVAALFGWRSRLRESSVSERYFPTAAHPARLGAQFGGGVIVETHPPAS